MAYTEECGECGGIMRVYDSNKTHKLLKCDTCKHTRKTPQPQSNRLF